MNIIIKDGLNPFNANYRLYVNGDNRMILSKKKELYAIDTIKGGDTITLVQGKKRIIIELVIDNPNNTVVVTRKFEFIFIDGFTIAFVIFFFLNKNIFNSSYSLYAFWTFIAGLVVWLTTFLIALFYPKKSFNITQEDIHIV